MIRICLAAALALAVTACARPRDDWGGIARGVEHVITADPAASGDAERDTAPHRR